MFISIKRGLTEYFLCKETLRYPNRVMRAFVFLVGIVMFFVVESESVARVPIRDVFWPNNG